MKYNNLISIITPSYNSEKFISETIKSVLTQTYQYWEMIIVDDCSPDNSNKIIEKFCRKDNRIKLIKLERNSGPAIARNRGIQEARGRYIAFLDADDLWKPDKLEKQLNFMAENKLSFTYSSYDLIDEDGRFLGTFKTKETISYESMLKTCSVGCLTAIYDTKILGKMFMPNILKRQDYGLWLKILKKIRTTKGIIEPLAIYRIRKDSVSSNKLKAALYQWKIYRDVEELSLFKSLYYFINYVYYGIKKYK
ncbi:glycosyl transferase [Deferribacter desulfuricans SSM1]|uniref:Glycosyl transferase n=1 Tax=Deferribacter desulfuricans (strain DSM 14783 / JCM 11476 / NBRC 101012 / SSM1) TaxID=639282 RepID=D3PBA4_DEFDS|nr:glycosyltransferase family 2 protein [Deferribacter desulfuricans]BAI79877.1 glycosyl transferase [Deferribacter desulfuricans SSM1]